MTIISWFEERREKEVKRMEVNVIHFTIDTTKYPSWEAKNNMLQHGMDKVEEIKKRAQRQLYS